MAARMRGASARDVSGLRRSLRHRDRGDASDRRTAGGPTLLYALLIGMLSDRSHRMGARSGVDSPRAACSCGSASCCSARALTFDEAGPSLSDALLVVGAVAANPAFGMGLVASSGNGAASACSSAVPTAILRGASAAIAIAAVPPRDEESEREPHFTVAGVDCPVYASSMILHSCPRWVARARFVLSAGLLPRCDASTTWRRSSGRLQHLDGGFGDVAVLDEDAAGGDAAAGDRWCGTLIVARCCATS